jgi:hypothetical protein
MGGITEIIGIFCKPRLLARRLARASAFGLGAEFLPVGVAVIRQEEDVTVLARPLADVIHDP